MEMKSKSMIETRINIFSTIHSDTKSQIYKTQDLYHILRTKEEGHVRRQSDQLKAGLC